MRRIIRSTKVVYAFLLVGFIFLSNIYCYGEDYNRFDIKYGMHERVVNKEYGQPILVEKIRRSPISKKKALYELDDLSYMVLYFFSGRIYKITLLQDMGLEEATSIFKEN